MATYVPGNFGGAKPPRPPFENELKKLDVKVVETAKAKSDIKVVHGGNLNKIKIDPAVLQDAIQKSIKQHISATATIPVALLDALGKKFASEIPEDKRGNLIVRKTLLKQAADDDNFKKMSAQISRQVHKFPIAYWAYYRALIRTMGSLVKDPGIPATGGKTANTTKRLKEGGRVASVSAAFNKSVQLNPHELQGAPVKSIQLQGQWAELKEATLKAKKELNTTPVFWHHTGEASAAFDVAAAARLAMIKPRHFMTYRKHATTQLVGSSAGRIGATKFVAKAEFNFTLGVPTWNSKLDSLITIPFATQHTNKSTLVGTGVTKVGSQEKGFKWVSVGASKLVGVDRLLVAEAHRPWLRNLSAQAGGALQNYLQSTATPVSRSANAGVAASRFQKDVEKFKAAKQHARNELLAANAAARKAKLDAPRLARETEAARRAALSPKEIQAELNAAHAVKLAKRRVTARNKTLSNAENVARRIEKTKKAKDTTIYQNLINRSSNQKFTKEQIEAARAAGLSPERAKERAEEVSTTAKVATTGKSKATPNDGRSRVISPLTGNLVLRSTAAKHANQLAKKDVVDSLGHDPKELIRLQEDAFHAAQNAFLNRSRNITLRATSGKRRGLASRKGVRKP